MNIGDIVKTKNRIMVAGTIFQAPATLYFVSQQSDVLITVDYLPNPQSRTQNTGTQFQISMYDVKYILSQLDNSILYDGTVDA